MAPHTNRRSKRAGARWLAALVFAGVLLSLMGVGLVAGDESAGSACYTLTLSVGGGSGTVQASPDHAGGCPAGQFDSGRTTTLIATPAGGYVFDHWSGTSDDNTNPTLITMSSDRTATAYFSWNCHQLTTSVGSGQGTVQASPASAGGCPSGNYPTGYHVTVTAFPSPGYRWTGWAGTDDNNTNPTQVTMSADRTATANFAWNCFQLSTAVGSAAGTVQVSPASSGGCPSGQYSNGYHVTVTAFANAGYRWTGWSGTDDDVTNPTQVTMSADRTATAYFAWNCFQLSTAVGGSGGTVQVSPTSAGGCPSGQYPSGYNVTVTAFATSGYRWTSWSGTNNDAVNPTQVTMNADRAVTAYFGWNCFQLTTAVGSGQGTIQVTPGSYGGCPNGQYPSGYRPTLTAFVGNGYTMSGWAGTDDNTANPTLVTMNADRTVTAYFVLPGQTPPSPPPPTATHTPTPTRTSTPVPTNTPTPTPTESGTPGPDATPPGETATPGPSETPAAGTPTPSPTPRPPTPTPAHLRGDADCNGRISAIDAALVLQNGAGLIPMLLCIATADVNNDDRVDAIDAALILQIGAGLLSAR